ncbi:MAG: glycosyltransferase [Bryobacteraceae bacterium]
MARAVEQGRPKDALRLADCACRIAPANPTCRLVHARLLIQLGGASEALDRLRGREEPEAVVTHAEALCLQGLLDDAAASVEGLLRRFAVDAVENLRPLAARLCRTSNKFAGWIGVDTSLRLVGEVRRGIPVSIAWAGRICHPSISAVDRDGVASFHFDMPAGVLDRVTAVRGDVPLLGSGFAWPPEFGLCGWVMLENKTLVGKARLDWAPTLPTTLAITRRGENIPLAVPSGAFSLPLDALTLNAVEIDAAEVEVSAVLPDGSRMPLSGSPVRMRALSPTPVGARPSRTVHPEQDHQRKSAQIVDVVVPVYTGLPETLLCLERVLATTDRSATELVVVNDASPDVELCEALAPLARDGRITLLANPSNLGFPGSANRGMHLHPERDVVLLNSDTEVFGDWLDRLKCAAYRADDIGTVTPLGEAASIMSYPGGGEQAHHRVDSGEIDRIAREVNAHKLIDLPVGVGFCLYMKRACLDEVGGFDENTFGKGYGEENDFCLRARRFGWRHVGAADLFVGHRGGRSYGRSKEMLLERNRRVLDALHPGYEALISGFVAADPLLQARRAIDTHRLLKEASDPILLVTCDLPGGVQRHVREQQSTLSAAGHTVLILQPAGTPSRADRVILTTQGSRFENLAFHLPEEAPILRDLLSKLGLSRIELHHFVGLPAATLELVTSLGVRYDVYVHDYSWVCPRVNLVGGNNLYCGEPAIEDCETCIRTHGTELEESLTVAALRTRSARILEGASEVIVPTEDVRGRLARYFPSRPVKINGWESPVQPRPRSSLKRGGRIRVGVIGAISIQKGQQILLQCAKDAAERNLDLDFVVIGYTSDDASLLETGRVFITGPYAESEINTLLEREQCQIAFFPSVAPETWCYALTHAMSWGLPIVAFDLGAIAERLHGYDAAQLLPLPAKAPDINDSLMEFVRRYTTSETQKELSMSDTSPINDSPVSPELEASAKVLTLPVGVFAFTVEGGAAAITADELAVPALQLGLAPMNSPGTVEFLAGAGTLDRWLTRSTDTFIVRISGGSVALLLTSVRFPDSPVLNINVQRIDAEQPALAPDVAANGASGVLPTQILAHIENFGDIYFGDGRAGFHGQKLRMEAFAILAVGPLDPDSIEYSGVMADGYQTPWLSNQILCGSRGRAVPLTGFAIRLKPEIAERYDCTYSGKFVSGSTFGPFKNGELCTSNVPGDPLEAFDLQIVERVRSEGKTPGQEMEYSDVK